MIRIPSHLYFSRHGIYYFRMVIPKHLRDILKKTEIRRSLGTGKRSEAIIKANGIYVQVYNLLKQMEGKMTKNKYKTEYIKATRKQTEKNGTITETFFEADHGDPELEEQQANRFLAQYNNMSSTAVTSETPRETFSPYLSVAIDEFCAIKITDELWDSKTQKIYKPRLRLLVEALNDKSMDSVTEKDANYIISVLKALPTNRNKVSAYKNKTLEEVLASKPQITLSGTTVSKCLNLYSSFFGWAKSKKYVQSNYFKGRRVKDKSKASKKWKVFSEEDLNKLLSKANFSNKNIKEKHEYWVPLLSLYTGARLGELCQLHLIDIYQKGNCWIIDVNDTAEDTKVKNETSIRKIPVHPLLIELGFIDYVNELKKRKEKRLFPKLKKGINGYGGKVSDWFREYRKDCGVTEKRKVFHSFRHTFINWLKQDISIDRSVIKALDGHKDESMTTGHYGEPYDPKILYEAICRITYRPPFIE